MSRDELIRELEELHVVASTSYRSDDVQSMCSLLEELGCALVRSAVLVAEAQQIRDDARYHASESPRALEMTATKLREFLAGKTSSEERLLTYSERLNKAITHRIDELRTNISFNKQLVETNGR